MNSYVAWDEIRSEHVRRAGGEAAVDAGKRQMLAEVTGHRLAEIRRARSLTQQQVADRMGVTKGRVSQPIWPRSTEACARRARLAGMPSRRPTAARRYGASRCSRPCRVSVRHAIPPATAPSAIPLRQTAF